MLMTRAVLVAAVLVATTIGCEIDYGVGSAPQQPLDVQPGPANKKIDILFVVDNSNSMAEEQASLARTIYKPECPISDLTQVPEALLDPEPGVLEDLSRVCGFSQILAAYDRDFRVGVITTDVDACDNVVPEAQGNAEHGFHPQRGCLQPVPSTGQKFLARSDVDVAGKFKDLMGNIGTVGSPYERGIDAVDIFLNRGSWVADGCENDRDDFIREDAQLLVIFVTDEDDCSHLGTDFGTVRDENGDVVSQAHDEALTECGAAADIGAYFAVPPSTCYEPGAALVNVDAFAQKLAGEKGITRAADVSVAVIGGAVDDVNGVIAGGCLAGAGGVPIQQCRANGGLSNFTGPGEMCEPQDGVAPCCTAEGAVRYFGLAGEIGTFTGGSICAANYIDTLITATQSTENDG